MLIALLIGLIASMLGGESPAVVKARISETVEDPARQNTALEIVDDSQERINEYMNNLETKVEKISTVHANYESTREDYSAVFDEVVAARKEFHADALQKRDELRETLTEEEWRQVFPGK